MFSLKLYFGLCLMLALGANAAFSIPNVRIEVLSPRGFRVSIPHRPGMQLCAFHGNVNREIHPREAGQYSIDINEPTNGRWTYTNRVQKLNYGDVINYWVFVDHFDGVRQQGYVKDYQTFVVT